MKTITEIAETVGATRFDIENWLARLELRSEFQAPGRGKARQFSQSNVLELALMAAFVKAGIEPRRALARADMVARQIRSGRKNLREWMLETIDSSGGSSLSVFDQDKLAQMIAEAGGAPVVRVIYVGEIVRRVEALFASAFTEVAENA